MAPLFRHTQLERSPSQPLWRPSAFSPPRVYFLIVPNRNTIFSYLLPVSLPDDTSCASCARPNSGSLDLKLCTHCVVFECTFCAFERCVNEYEEMKFIISSRGDYVSRTKQKNEEETERKIKLRRKILQTYRKYSESRLSYITFFASTNRYPKPLNTRSDDGDSILYLQNVKTFLRHTNIF